MACTQTDCCMDIFFWLWGMSISVWILEFEILVITQVWHIWCVWSVCLQNGHLHVEICTLTSDVISGVILTYFINYNIRK